MARRDLGRLPILPWLRAHGQGHRRELAVLVLLLVVAGAIWAFIALAGEVTEGDTRALDQRILLSLRTPGDVADPLGPGWAEEMGRDFTALGGIAVLGLVTVATAVYLFLDRKQRAGWFVLGAVGGGLALSLVLKDVFGRPRPQLVPHLAVVYTSSFPSGHSMLSAVTYLTLGALLARIHPRRVVKGYFLGLAVAVTVCVGVSRVYLACTGPPTWWPAGPSVRRGRSSVGRSPPGCRSAARSRRSPSGIERPRPARLCRHERGQIDGDRGAATGLARDRTLPPLWRTMP